MDGRDCSRHGGPRKRNSIRAWRTGWVVGGDCCKGTRLGWGRAVIGGVARLVAGGRADFCLVAELTTSRSMTGFPRLAGGRRCHGVVGRLASSLRRYRICVSRQLPAGANGDAVDLDVKRARPYRNTREHSSRRVFREVANIHRVYGVELVCRSAINVTFQSAFKR